MHEPEYLSMGDRIYDDDLPPDHFHNRIAIMQAENRKAKDEVLLPQIQSERVEDISL